MSIERSFKHFYPVPHNGGFIEPIIHIEYEAHDWSHDHAGSIDVIDATLGFMKFVKDNDNFDFIKAVMNDTEREVAQAWLDQTHTHTHIHIHTYTNTNRQILIQIYKQTNKQTQR